MAKVEGLEQLSVAFEALKHETKFQLGRAVETSAVEAARTIQAAMPVGSTLDPHPGALKASVHVKPGDSPLKAQIVADAKDAHGREYGAHVEFGHRAEGGVHVPAQPAFYPGWRLARKKALNRIKRAVNSAAKTAAKG